MYEGNIVMAEGVVHKPKVSALPAQDRYSVAQVP